MIAVIAQMNLDVVGKELDNVEFDLRFMICEKASTNVSYHAASYNYGRNET